MPESPRTIPAVEYRTLWERLAEMRKLDPDNRELLWLMRDFSRLGQDAGVVIPTRSKRIQDGAKTSGETLDPAFDWDRGTIALSPNDALLLERVAKVTFVPE